MSEVNEKKFEPKFKVQLSNELSGRMINGYYNRKKDLIVISRYIYERHPGLFYEVLKHEVIHWYVSQYSNHYRDGEETFEKELRKHKAITNGNYPFADKFPTFTEQVDTYQCIKCDDSVLYVIEGYEPEKYQCPWCLSEMKFKEKGKIEARVYKYKR